MKIRKPLAILTGSIPPGVGTSSPPITLSQHHWAKLKMLAFTLTTSAVAGNRLGGLYVLSPGDSFAFAQVYSSSNHAAGLEARYTFLDGIAATGSPANGWVQSTLGEFWIPPGYSLRASGVLTDAGDAWSNIRYVAVLVDANPVKTI